MTFRNKTIFLVALVLIGTGIIASFASSNFFWKTSGHKVKVTDLTFTKVDIVTPNTAVKLLPTERQEAVVSFKGERRKKKYSLRAEVKGDTLHVRLKEKSWLLFNFDFSRRPTILTVELPEKVYAGLQVKSDNGKIDVRYVQTDHLSLRTDNGAIDVKNVQAGMTFAKTDNGRISLDSVEGEIQAITDNGRISLKTADLHRTINLKTDNGRIEVETDEMPTNATIEASTDNGRLHIFGQSKETVTYGNGTHLIKLKTDNGGIRVTN